MRNGVRPRFVGDILSSKESRLCKCSFVESSMLYRENIDSVAARKSNSIVKNISKTSKAAYSKVVSVIIEFIELW